MAPRDAVGPSWQLVDTHSHVHQAADSTDLGLGVAPSESIDDDGTAASEHGIAPPAPPRDLAVCAVLAVSEDDWPNVLALASAGVPPASNAGASASEPSSAAPSSFSSAAAGLGVALVPGLGIHPWYVQDANDGWAARLRAQLVEHPGTIVGEIGLCKCAKNLRGPGNKEKHWPMQLAFFSEQLAIAADLRRPATVHNVKAMGPMLQLLKDGAAIGALPPALAMHSYNGTALQMAEILALEQPTGTKPPPENRKARKARIRAEAAAGGGGLPAAEASPLGDDPARQAGGESAVTEPAPGRAALPPPPEAATAAADAPRTCEFFFGFSHTINVAMGGGKPADRARLLDVIRAVPDDRLLLESDEVAGSGPGGGTGGGPGGSSSGGSGDGGSLGRAAVAMRLGVALVVEAKGWTPDEAAERTAANGMRFLRAGPLADC